MPPYRKFSRTQTCTREHYEEQQKKQLNEQRQRWLVRQALNAIVQVTLVIFVAALVLSMAMR